MPTDLPPGYGAREWTPEAHRQEALQYLGDDRLASSPDERSVPYMLYAIAHLLAAGAAPAPRADRNLTGMVGFLAVLAAVVACVYLVAR